MPRNREGTFEPQSLKKYEKDISNIENQIISMYGKGMTIRDNIISHQSYIWFWHIRNNGK
ncbi:transposase [Anaerococcus sp.]|uniref:transposase n=1 Tax=Anaerococcus sp. TaxID=1872515 RepID=UPI0028FEA82F|nr:transposase [Anaerococcus sp.]MDU3212372.1 transposase [Anaerococcus sp.]